MKSNHTTLTPAAVAAAVVAVNATRPLTAQLDPAAVVGGSSVVLMWRDATPADADLAAARDALTRAVKAADALTDADPDATRKEAAATVKAARAAVKAAKAAAVAAAETATRHPLTVGLAVSETRPAAALTVGHAIADALTVPPQWVKVGVYFNLTAHPDLILAAARAVAKKVAANAFQREATPLYTRLDRAARSGDWDDADLADLTDAAALALAHGLTADPVAVAAAIETAAALYADLAARLARLSPADRAARAVAVARAEAASRGYTPDGDADPRIVADPATLKRRAAEAARLAAALREADPARRAERLTAAAYAAVNGHIADARALHIDERAPALNVDALTDAADPAATIADPRSEYGADVVSEYDARRRQIVREAAALALPALTPAQTAALKALYRTTGGERAAARLTRRHVETLRGHRAIVAARFSEAVAIVAPDSIERDALSLAAYAAAAETATAAAEKYATTARRRSVTEAAAAETLPDVVRDALAALPPAMRDAARLVARGASQREAAARLSKSRATVREAVAAAARRVAAVLTEADPVAAASIPPEAVARGDLLAVLAAVC